MDLREYVRALRRGWMLIIVCAVLALASAFALVSRSTPQYASTIRMFVSTPQSGDDSAAYQGGQFSQQRVISYGSLIVGEQVAIAVLDDLDLPMSPAQLQAELSSRVVPDTVLLDLTVTDPSALRAQAIANAAGVAFAGYVADLESPSRGVAAAIAVTVVDPATLANTPSSPRPLRTLPLAGVLGLLAGVGVALLRQTLDRTVKDVTRLAERLGAPALGLIGYDSEAKTSPLPIQTRPHSAHAESFRQVRTNLQFVDIDQRAKTFVITSSLPGEGKTHTAANLAFAIAQAGQRVILVEADLRRPRINSYLGLVQEVGLTTVLMGQVTLEDALQPCGEMSLQVLACGVQPPNPSEMLSSDRMLDLLAELRSRADVVIIDAPPLLPVTDAAILARRTDGAILVVRHGKTTYEQVARSVETLDLAGGAMLGTIVNMTPVRGADSYAYGYEYAAPTASGRPLRSHAAAAASKLAAPAVRRKGGSRSSGAHLARH